MSAMFDLIMSRYSSSTGSRHIFSPDFFSDCAEALVEIIVIGEDADVDHAQRDDDSAGQRGGVDQVGRAQLLARNAGRRPAPGGLRRRC